MLKVCGVTYDHTLNYGSCFQAYALKNAVENMLIHDEKCEYYLVPLSTYPDYNRKKGLLNIQRIRFHRFEKK